MPFAKQIMNYIKNSKNWAKIRLKNESVWLKYSSELKTNYIFTISVKNRFKWYIHMLIIVKN